jgi:hypothetical protein
MRVIITSSPDNATIEEHPTLRIRHAVAVSGLHVDGAPCEGFEIDPAKCHACAVQLLQHDLPAGLLDSFEASGSEFGQQRRLAASRAVGEEHMLAAMVVCHRISLHVVSCSSSLDAL